VPRYKHTAVARNRLKRRLRELARLRLLPALADLPPADVVVRVWPSAYAADFDALAADMGRAVRQLSGGAGRGPRADGGSATAPSGQPESVPRHPPARDPRPAAPPPAADA